MNNLLHDQRFMKLGEMKFEEMGFYLQELAGNRREP